MSKCSTSGCQTSVKKAKHSCPANGRQSIEVPKQTVLHHLAKPWLHPLKDQKYYFCSDPNCNVVYFGDDNMLIHTNELRTRIGIKDQSAEALICYCFGVSRADAISNKQVREFVIQQTKASTCACEVFNPSGRCCLKDFPDL